MSFHTALNLSRSAGMTKHPRDGGDSVTLSLPLSLGAGNATERAKKQPRRVPTGDDGAREFVCKTCSRAFASFQALGGHRTSHLRGCHGLTLGLAASTAAAAKATAVTTKQEKPAAAHDCHFCGQALGGHMRRHREEAAATAQASPVLLQLFV